MPFDIWPSLTGPCQDQGATVCQYNQQEENFYIPQKCCLLDDRTLVHEKQFDKTHFGIKLMQKIRKMFDIQHINIGNVFTWEGGPCFHKTREHKVLPVLSALKQSSTIVLSISSHFILELF
jgi:hypothetical protein